MRPARPPVPTGLALPLALAVACTGQDTHQEREALAHSCCTCCAGSWSGFDDCTLLRDQEQSYRSCAAGTGLEDAVELTLHHLRDPTAAFSGEPTELLATATVCEEILIGEADNVVVATTTALLRLEAGETERAGEALRELATQPWHSERPALAVELFSGLGRAQARLGRTERAEESLLRPLLSWELATSDPAYLSAIGRLASFYRAGDRTDLGGDCEVLASAIGAAPPLQAFDKGMSAYLAGNAAEALAALEPTTTTLAEHERDGCAAVGNQLFSRLHTLHGFSSLASGKIEEAAASLARAKSLDPLDPGMQAGLGHVDLRRGEYAQAEASFRSQTEAPAPHSSPVERVSAYRLFALDMAWIGLGWSLDHQGNPGGALPCYDQVLARNPDAVLALLGKAGALVGLDRTQDAEAVVDHLLTLAPNHPDVLVQAGIVRYLRGDDLRAETHFLGALTNDGGASSCPYEGLGLVYLRQGDGARAKKHFEKAITLDPDAEYKKYNGMARILLDAGEWDRAGEMLAKSKANQPDNPDADLLLAELTRARAGRGP